MKNSNSADGSVQIEMNRFVLVREINFIHQKRQERKEKSKQKQAIAEP